MTIMLYICAVATISVLFSSMWGASQVHDRIDVHCPLCACISSCFCASPPTHEASHENLNSFVQFAVLVTVCTHAPVSTRDEAAADSMHAHAKRGFSQHAPMDCAKPVHGSRLPCNCAALQAAYFWMAGTRAWCPSRSYAHTLESSRKPPWSCKRASGGPCTLLHRAFPTNCNVKQRKLAMLCIDRRVSSCLRAGCKSPSRCACVGIAPH